MHSLAHYALLGSLLAAAAGLGILGLMQTTSLTPRAIAAVDDGKVGERLHALEARLAGAELQIQGRTAPELRAWEARLARLETRLGAVEDRAAVAERQSIAAEQLARERRDERARTAPVGVPRRAPTITPSAPVLLAPKPAATAPPSASPRLVPPPAGGAGVVARRQGSEGLGRHPPPCGAGWRGTEGRLAQAEGPLRLLSHASRYDGPTRGAGG